MSGAKPFKVLPAYFSFVSVIKQTWYDGVSKRNDLDKGE